MINTTPKFGESLPKYGNTGGFPAYRISPHIYHGVPLEQTPSIFIDRTLDII